MRVSDVECSICGKFFGSQRGLNHHTAKVHKAKKGKGGRPKKKHTSFNVLEAARIPDENTLLRQRLQKQQEFIMLMFRAVTMLME